MKEWLNKVSILFGNIFSKKISEIKNNYTNITDDEITTLFKNSLFKQKTVTIYLDDSLENIFALFLINHPH